VKDVNRKVGLLQTPVKSFQHENRLLKAEVEMLAAKLAKSDADLKGANARVAEARDQSIALEMQTRQLRDEIQATTASHTATIAELSITNTQAAIKLQNMTEQTAILEKQNNSLQTDNEMLMAESQTRGCKNEQLVAEISSTQEYNSVLRTKNALFQQNNKSILQEKMEIQAELEHAQARNNESGNGRIADRWSAGLREDGFSGQGVSGESSGENKYWSMSIGNCKFKIIHE
jgi:chromosome segregation ATPase